MQLERKNGDSPVRAAVLTPWFARLGFHVNHLGSGSVRFAVRAVPWRFPVRAVRFAVRGSVREPSCHTRMDPYGMPKNELEQ